MGMCPLWRISTHWFQDTRITLHLLTASSPLSPTSCQVSWLLSSFTGKSRWGVWYYLADSPCQGLECMQTSRALLGLLSGDTHVAISAKCPALVPLGTSGWLLLTRLPKLMKELNWVQGMESETMLLGLGI